MANNGSFLTKICDMKMRSNRRLEIRNLDEDDRKKLDGMLKKKFKRRSLVLPLSRYGNWLQQGEYLPIPFCGVPGQGARFRGTVTINVKEQNGRIGAYASNLTIVHGEVEEEKIEEPRYDLFGEFAGYMQLKRY